MQVAGVVLLVTVLVCAGAGPFNAASRPEPLGSTGAGSVAVPCYAGAPGIGPQYQVQALDRTQPSLPMRPGRAGTMTHDYLGNGTVDLFVALNIKTGEVITDCRQRHTSADVLAFFKQVDRSVPRGLSVHVVLDNLSAHMGPEVEAWLAHKRQARWNLHFVPPSSSWLNLVERWFADLTERRLRRGVFTCVGALVEALGAWAASWNENPKPFVWHKAAEEIIEKVRRGRAAFTRSNPRHV